MRYHWIDTKSCQYLVGSRWISTRSRWIWQDLIELVGGDQSSRLESDSDATVDQPTFRNLISGGCNPPINYHKPQIEWFSGWLDQFERVGWTTLLIIGLNLKQLNNITLRGEIFFLSTNGNFLEEKIEILLYIYIYIYMKATSNLPQ